MLILSHRGYWKYQDEKNTLKAFKRSFSLSFGAEIDIRDYKGSLVVSHGIANEKCISLEKLFRTYKSINSTLQLALNIKADGLHLELKKLLKKYSINNYFVFDMSIPDSLLYLRNNMNVFTRESEYETAPPFYNTVKGIVIDEFERHWINKEKFQKYLLDGKIICIISPELHEREYKVDSVKYFLYFDKSSLT